MRPSPGSTPVQIQVTAACPGADAQSVAQNVGAPTEQQANGADNMIYMLYAICYMQSTTSSSGNYTLDAFSDIGTDPSLAQVDVQNLVQWASPELPSLVTEQGVIVKKTTSSFINAINRDIKQLKNPCYFKHQKGQKAPCSLAS